MSSYLITNYKGKYTLQAEVDKNTGDFCRDEKGMLDNYSDIWIECQGKGKIFHYGKSVLYFYCPSLGRGHNIVKSIYENVIGNVDKFIITKVSDEGKESKSFDYDLMNSELVKNGIIFDIEETDSEILFKFKANNFEKLEQYIKPKTNCPNRSCFSVKNLRKQATKNSKDNGEKHTISNEKLTEYKAVTSQISKEDISVYNKINNGYLDVLSKKTRKSVAALKDSIKTSGMKFKEYISSMGDDIWNQYLEYIKNYLKENK